jgi:hypothetical protein
MKRRSNPEIKKASRVQVAFLTTGVGWAAVSAGPPQERRSRLAQMILPTQPLCTKLHRFLGD